MTKKAVLSQWLQIGAEETPLPPLAKSWEDYRQTTLLLKVVCALVNSTLKPRRDEPALYLIDDGGCAGVEAMTVLTPPEDLED